MRSAGHPYGMSTDVQHTTTLSDRVAEEIRALLARRRITGRELARRLNISPNWVSLRLSGAQEIGVNDLARIAEALAVQPTDLFPGERHATARKPPRSPLDARLARPPGRSDPTRPVRETRPGGPQGLRRPALLTTA